MLQALACNTDTTQTQTHQISNTERTENKTTDVVIQRHSRKILMMDILMSETCWVHKKWNKIASDIKLVFYSSNVTLFIVVRNRQMPSQSCSSHQSDNGRGCVKNQYIKELTTEIRKLKKNWSDPSLSERDELTSTMPPNYNSQHCLTSRPRERYSAQEYSLMRCRVFDRLFLKCFFILNFVFRLFSFLQYTDIHSFGLSCEWSLLCRHGSTDCFVAARHFL